MESLDHFDTRNGVVFNQALGADCTVQSIFTNSIKEQEKRHQIYEIVYTIMNQAQGPKKAVKRLNMDFWLINIFFALTRIAIMVFFYSGWFSK